VLSRKGGPAGQPKTGQYSVDVEAFEALALPTLADDDDPSVVYILDEIGRMELHSHAFSLRVRALLARGVRLLGAITAPIYGHRVTFCDSVSASRGVVVHKLTAKIRDEVVLQLATELTERWHVPRVAPLALTRGGPLTTTTRATTNESRGRDAAALKRHKIA
jgi:nucleoside-triphosphatase